ncbi:MAG TPA: hypothetical protein VEG44_08505 [Candidatus Acidoferrales bacterium]|nr:hypothetical protein [Candidatus Acidoferrales bacterium]
MTFSGLLQGGHIIGKSFLTSDNPYIKVNLALQNAQAQIEREIFVKSSHREVTSDDIKLVYLNSANVVTKKDLDNLRNEFIDRIGKLEKKTRKKKPVTKADRVYNRFKKELEQEYFGKIVAIDVDLSRVVGIGDTFDEAYDRAIEETGKEQFDFKRVGHSYLFKF